MSRMVAYSIAFLTAILLFVDRTRAEVIEKSVTPASIREKNSKFAVIAEKCKDGLIHFTITYRLPMPQYLVAHFELRDGQTPLVKTDTPRFARESSATFYVAVSPKRLADSTFELSENPFEESGGQAVALPGGTIYQISLQAFGKDAPAAKMD